jgi:hypothetical protein
MRSIRKASRSANFQAVNSLARKSCDVLSAGSFPLTEKQRVACGNAKRCAEAAERALMGSADHVSEVGMEQDPVVLEVVGDLVEEYLLLGAGEALLPPPAPELPSYFGKVAAEHRARGWTRPTGSPVRTDEDLQRQLAYLEGFPEAQRAAGEAFRQQRRRAAT